MSRRGVLGTFDGVHIGHRALFFRARERAAEDAMPILALVILRSGPFITDLCEREELLREAGADQVVFLPLEEVRHMSAEDFVSYIKDEYGVSAAVCGYDFRFGKDRAGDAALLSSLIQTDVVPEQRVDGHAVSSSRIRQALSEGRAEEAAAMLGRSYSISGQVGGGKRLGRTKGYPTANIPYPEGRAELRRGVYFTRVWVGEDCYDAVSNCGVCPTVQGESTVVESYLLDFHGELYGSFVKTEFLHFLRGEERFSHIDALYERIALDKEAAIRYFKGKGE